MNRQDLPTLVSGMTVISSWTSLASTGVRVSGNAGRVGRVLIPVRSVERLLWMIWVPLVFAWMSLPLIAVFGRVHIISSPVLPEAWIHSSAWTALRWAAAGVGVLCLLG